ncbi:hypothetical protein N0V95_004104 [Ascochyta clinopodiicola]|nr:hypothetical protein N0V95_004104 [Ascochyta clinopodiicola]
MGEQIPLEPTRADHYLTLGVSQTATTAQIKKAFHRLALIHHPDKSAPGQTVDAADFRQVKEAYERKYSNAPGSTMLRKRKNAWNKKRGLLQND